MKPSIKNILSLSIISAIVALLLAATYFIAAPIIEKNEAGKADAALLEVMPSGGSFEEVDLAGKTLPKTVTKAHKAKNGGYVVQLTTSGYQPNMVLLIGVDEGGKITGAVCLSSGETLGYEKTYGDGFKDKDLAAVKEVDTISGATKTTSGYKNAVVDAINTATILAGGDVDIRDEDEILRDKLNEALPEAEGKFSRLFLVEALDGITAVYSADNKKGSVYLIGDKAYGVPTEGSFTGSPDDATQTLLTAAKNALAASKSSMIDIPTFPSANTAKIVKAEKTESGNYIFTIHTEGITYGSPWYTPMPIVIKVAMTKDGKIIDCRTLYQFESTGYGDACAEESYTDQFAGKNHTDYKGIDAISGATITNNAYLDGIAKAYAALSVLESKEFRSEDEIFQDTLATMFPTTEGRFSASFLVEPIEGITAVFTSADGKNLAFVLGEKTVGLAADGSFIGDITDAEKTVLTAAKEKMTAWKTTELKITLPEDPKVQLKKAEITANGIYVFTVHTYGITYDSPWYTPTPIVIMLSMNEEGKILNCVTVSQGESKGYGDKCAEESYYGNYVGKTESDYNKVDTIAGCTITHNAYLAGIQKAYVALEILESQKLRLDKEIFLIKPIEGIEKAYTSNDGKKYAFVLGDKTVGIAEDGSFLGDITDTEKTLITNAKAEILSWTTTEVTVTLPEDPKVQLKKAEKTADSIYVFTVHTYGITYDSPWYTPTPIVIMLSMKEDGKILNCLTVSQGESKGYGDKCAEESYYGNYVGKTEGNYNTVDTIAGCTITHNAYLAGIQKAYDALDALKGE